MWKRWTELPVDAEEPCILPFGQQGSPKMVAERLALTGCRYGKEHEIHTDANWFKFLPGADRAEMGKLWLGGHKRPANLLNLACGSQVELACQRLGRCWGCSCLVPPTYHISHITYRFEPSGRFKRNRKLKTAMTLSPIAEIQNGSNQQATSM